MQDNFREVYGSIIYFLIKLLFILKAIFTLLELLFRILSILSNYYFDILYYNTEYYYRKSFVFIPSLIRL